MPPTNHGRPLGYSRILTGGKTEWEADWVKCEHCQGVIHLRPLPPATAKAAPPRSDEWGYCAACDGKVCRRCYDLMSREVRCVNWERRVEDRESSKRLAESLTWAATHGVGN